MEEKTLISEEKVPAAISGMLMLILGVLLLTASIILFVFGVVGASQADAIGMPAPNGAVAMIIVGAIYWVFAWVPFAGLKIIRPNEALVLTLFGKYYGSLRKPGFFYVNPFCAGVNPAVREPGSTQTEAAAAAANTAGALDNIRKKDSASGKKISLKAITHNNGKQKINDLLGNPIDVGIVVIWRVVNTAKAVFNVDDYREYLSIQTDAALRNTIRLYPYDVADGGDDFDGQTSLRGSSQAVANRIKDELQQKVDIAGLEIIETRITYLAYSPEIAAAMEMTAPTIRAGLASGTSTFVTILKFGVPMGCATLPTSTTTLLPSFFHTGTCFSWAASVVLGLSSCITSPQQTTLAPLSLTYAIMLPQCAQK